jgi:hypothetical protein
MLAVAAVVVAAEEEEEEQQLPLLLPVPAREAAAAQIVDVSKQVEPVGVWATKCERGESSQ